MSKLKSLRVERRSAGVASVEISRPEKLNAMDQAFFLELTEVLGELDRDAEAVACVLTGAGRAFSAGADFNDFARLAGPEDFGRQLDLALSTFSAVERAETVVIAAVNGIAFAGGTELTLAADIAFASRTASFSFREVTIGLMPTFGVVRGPEAIGRGWTSLLALSGTSIDADEARRIGLVQRVCEPDHLLDQAFALAEQIAANPRPAVRAAKRFINRGSEAGIAEAIEATGPLFGSDEHKDLVAAFLDPGRKPSTPDRSDA